MDQHTCAAEMALTIGEIAPARSPRTILIVDDEPDLVATIAAELRFAGYRPLTAYNGRDALTVLDREPVDLILADVCMPVMGGHELLRILRTEHPQLADLPFVFLSALADRGDIIAGRRRGADDYLTKPVDFDMMLTIIEARLGVADKASERRLTAIEDFRCEILSLLPYELLTPLTAILGWASLGQRAMEHCSCDSQKQPSIAQAFQEIGQGALTLQHLIEGTVELVRLHEQPIRQLYPTEIGDLVLGAVEVVKAQAAEIGVHLSAEVPDGLPEIDTDPYLLGRTLFALLGEATKDMQRSSVVGVRVAQADAWLAIIIDRRGTSRSGLVSRKVSIGIGSALASAAAKTLGGSFETVPVKGGDVSRLVLPLNGLPAHERLPAL